MPLWGARIGEKEGESAIFLSISPWDRRFFLYKDFFSLKKSWLSRQEGYNGRLITDLSKELIPEASSGSSISYWWLIITLATEGAEVTNFLDKINDDKHHRREKTMSSLET